MFNMEQAVAKWLSSSSAIISRNLLEYIATLRHKNSVWKFFRNLLYQLSVTMSAYTAIDAFPATISNARV
jgi:hypothetical protein